MDGLSREEYIGTLRRKSSGFSRGVSKYRGVARHHHNGRWEARIGRVFGNKYLYLGTYATQEEAATAYDMAAIEYRGLNAVTNFDLSRYIKWLRPNNNNTANEPIPDFETPSSNHSSGSTSTITATSTSASTALYPYSPPLQSTTTILDASLCQTQPPSSTSALGLLLQSTKFKEMMEMTLASDEYSPAPAESNPPQSSFPEDLKTYFDIQDFSSYSNQGEDLIFNEINSFILPLTYFDFNA